MALNNLTVLKSAFASEIFKFFYLFNLHVFIDPWRIILQKKINQWYLSFSPKHSFWAWMTSKIFRPFFSAIPEIIEVKVSEKQTDRVSQKLFDTTCMFFMASGGLFSYLHHTIHSP